MSQPLFVSFHDDNSHVAPIVYFLAKRCGFDVSLKRYQNRTFVIDHDPIHEMYQIKEILTTPPPNMLSRETKYPEPRLEGFHGDIVMMFVTIVTSYDNTKCGCYLKCNDPDRHFILLTDPIVQYLYLWQNEGCTPSWHSSLNTYNKTFETLYLEPHRIQKVQSLIQNFTTKREFYMKQGIPYKMTFLLEGRPGTGKTSFIKALSKETGYDVFLMNLDGITRVEQMLNGIKSLTENSRTSYLLVFEDIHKVSKELYSQIYNVLDGAYNMTNCVIVITTNVPCGTLDPCLMRCGRINYVIKFDFMTPTMKAQMFDHMVPQFASVKESFLKEIESISITPAILEAYLLGYCFETTPEALMKGLPLLIQTTQIENATNHFDETLDPPNLMTIPH